MKKLRHCHPMYSSPGELSRLSSYRRDRA